MKLLRQDPTLVDLSTTNFRIVVTMRLVVAAITVAMGSFIYAIVKDHHALAIDILDSTLFALVVLAGVDAAQFAAKRFSERPPGKPPQVITTEGGPISAAGPLQVAEPVPEPVQESPP